MARFAGDYFGISIADEDDGGTSKLLSYFPGLRNTFGKKSERDENQPVQFGNKTAAKPFGGFKPNLGSMSSGNESSNKTPAFGGSKPGEYKYS
jgi:hypothetical protein